MAKQAKHPYEKDSRCWPGYEPVPGKRQHQEGSCRKIPASRNAGVEVKRGTARHKAEQAATNERERLEIQSKSRSAKTRAAARRKLHRLEQRR